MSMKLFDILKQFFGSEGSNIKEFKKDDVNLAIEIKTDDDAFTKSNHILHFILKK